MIETHYLLDVLVLLGAAVLVVPVFQKLGLGSVLGYLAAGAIVGPWGIGFIDQTEEIRHIAEFGVVFLLFIIGVELKPAHLWSMRREVFGLGSTQLLLTGAAIALVVLLLDQSLKTAVIIGLGLALSSTAFGLQILNESGEMNRKYGRTVFSVLLLQDLSVVPLLALVSMLSTDTTNLLKGIEYAILYAVLVIALVVLNGRYLLSPVLKLVAGSRSPEVFIAAALFFVLGTAWLLETAGFSLALGAFVAGLLMAESQYRHQVIADIEPFRGILLGLFFMAVAMSIDFGILLDDFAVIGGLVLALLVVKSTIAWAACRVWGVYDADARRSALLLSQSGEFGFVLFGLAASNSLISNELFQYLTLIIVISMMSTPLMHRLGTYLSNNVSTASHGVSNDDMVVDPQQARVIIAGFGRVGRRVAKLLRALNIPYLAVEKDVERVLAGRHDGFFVYYGNASHVDVLKTVGAGISGVVVCTLDNTMSAVQLVNTLKQHYPDIIIHARGHDSYHCDQLLQAGANTAISETFEESMQLGRSVLQTLDVADEDITSMVDKFRKEYYQ